MSMNFFKKKYTWIRVWKCLFFFIHSFPLVYFFKWKTWKRWHKKWIGSVEFFFLRKSCHESIIINSIMIVVVIILLLSWWTTMCVADWQSIYIENLPWLAHLCTIEQSYAAKNLCAACLPALCICMHKAF